MMILRTGAAAFVIYTISAAISQKSQKKKKEIGIGVQVSDFKMTNSIIRRCHGQTNKASCTFGSNCKSCYLGL
jgi:hypothetical protein